MSTSQARVRTAVLTVVSVAERVHHRPAVPADEEPDGNRDTEHQSDEEPGGDKRPWTRGEWRAVRESRNGHRYRVHVPAEREITEPVDLTLPSGRLNRAAVGWSRTPLHRTDGIGRGRVGWGRNKRWEYWAVTSPTHVAALVVSDIGYAAVTSVFVLDRRSGEQIAVDGISPLARGTSLPGTFDAGSSRTLTRDLQIDLQPERDGTRIRAHTERVVLDVHALLPDGHERLSVVVPWSDRLFQYTIKDPARPAVGRLTVDGTAYEIGGEDAWATLDHGRGRWPYSIAWNWGAGSGTAAGHRIGLQVGGKWTDGTGSTENAIVVDGRLTKVSDELRWDYSPRDWMAPWRVHGGSVDVTFHPEHMRRATTQLGVLASRTHQCFGTWTGRVADVRVDGIYGWAEDVRQRW